MATISSFRVGGTTGHPSRASVRAPYMVEAVLDAALTNIPDDDVVQMINIPAGTIVLAAGLEVLTAVTGQTTPVWNLGHGGDVDEWGASLDVSSVGYKTGVTAAGDLAFTVFGTATADTIDIVANATSGTATAGRVRVWALMLDMDGVRSTATGDQG